MNTIASSLYNGGTSVDANGVAIKGTGFNSLGDNFGDIGTIAFGTLSGGAGAALTGGNFYLIDNCFQRYSMNLRFGKVL